MKILTQILLIIFSLAFSTTNTLKVASKELDLVNFLFNKSRSHRQILPSVDRNEPLNVVVGLTIYRIKDLVEKTQQLITDAVLHLSWNDPRMAWDPLKFGNITDIVVNLDKIWLPDVVLYNSANHQHNSRRRGLSRPLIYYDGNVTLTSPAELHAICDLNVVDYPMDKQRCDLVFGSVAHHSKQICLKSMHEKFHLNRYISNGQWEIVKAELKHNLVQDKDDPENEYCYVTFTLSLNRRVLYYAMYLIIPGTLIALLASIIFVLPQDCSERITVGMAILVALSFFFLLVSEKMPATGRVSIIGGYYAVTMIQMTISFFLNVLVLRFHHMTEDEVPDWVKKYVLNYGARLLRMKFRESGLSVHSKKRRKFLLARKKRLDATVEELMNKKFPAENCFFHDKIISSVFETKIKMTARDAEWKKAAEVLNNYSLILHVLAVVLTFGFVFVENLFFSN